VNYMLVVFASTARRISRLSIKLVYVSDTEDRCDTLWYYLRSFTVDLIDLGTVWVSVIKNV
jgi:hypothetical protein